MENATTLVTALAVLGYALFARRLDRWWVSMPATMLVAGLIVGPLGFGLLEADLGSEDLKTLAELTLALMLFHDAVRIDVRVLRRGRSVPLRLLGIGLPVMIVFGAAAAHLIFPQLGLVGAALLATMLAPTDAALGAAVVSDERVPVRIRQGLNVESGLNDGLSVPIFLVLLGLAADPGSAERGALAIELVRQIGFGVLSGAIIGGASGALMRFSIKRDLGDIFWRRIAVAATAVGCFVGAAVLGGSGFIGAFVGGAVFGIASELRSPEENIFTEYVGSLFDSLSFLAFGAVMLPFVLDQIDWRVMLYAVLSLVVVRMVSVFVAMLRSGARWPTVAFMGWFGPRGLATLVFAVLVFDAAIPNGDLIVAVAAAGIALSVLSHGFTAPPLVARYSAWWSGQPTTGTTPMEEQAVHEHAPGMSVSARAD